MKPFIKDFVYVLPEEYETLHLSKLANETGSFSKFTNDPKHPFHPKRSDSKIMRADVIASIIKLSEFFERLGIREEEHLDMSLYIANACFLEETNRYIERINKILDTFTIEDKESQAKVLYKYLPPLSALETLNNSTMSFVAQYLNIHGNNSTYGTSSYSSYMVFHAGINDILLKQANHVLLGGSNVACSYSGLYNWNKFPEHQGWKESSCASYLLLQNHAESALAQISTWKTNDLVPSLIHKPKYPDFKQFFKELEPIDQLVYSGAYQDSDHERMQEALDGIAPEMFSCFDTFGNMGSSNMSMNVCKAVELIQADKAERVGALDYDLFGRVSYLEIQAVKP